MKDIVGYKLFRTAAGDTAVIGNGNGPLRTSSMRALRDPGGNCIVKMSSGRCDLELPGLWFYSLLEPKASSIKPQASSPKLQASSSKPQASSSMILWPRKSFTAPEPRCWTMIKVLLGCFTWNDIWCGEKRTLLPLVTFNSTVKKWPKVL